MMSATQQMGVFQRPAGQFMPQHTTQAVILRTYDFAESDRLVAFYTKDFGLLRGVAKGAKRSLKRFGSALEPFTFNEVTFFTREHQDLVRLERCRIVRAFPEIANNLRRMALGAYLLELVLGLSPEREIHPEVYRLLVFSIDQLTQTSFRESMIHLFELRLFGLLGYEPQFMHCVACNAPFDIKAAYHFSVQRGGIVCPRCEPPLHNMLPISNGTIRLFQQARSLSLLKLNRLYFSREAREETHTLFSRFLEYHMGRRPRSLDILEQL
jgi:DNA repair protein RecO (recombination protein O)